jgi:methionyl-tRNA synthetase
MTLAEKYLQSSPVGENEKVAFSPVFINAIESYNLQIPMVLTWSQISKIDETIQKTQPFKVIKEDSEKGVEMIKNLVKDLFVISKHLEVFLPETSEKILTLIRENKKPQTPLFARKD